MSELKVCKVCGEGKPETGYYHKSKTRLDSVCKQCRIAGKTIPVIETTTKVCKHCGIEKPFSEYQKAGGGKWLQPYCKPCDAERKKKHHEANKEEILSKRLNYYYENKELISEKEKAKRLEYRKQNPVLPRVRPKMSPEEKKAKKSLSDKKYREKNKEKVKEMKKRYYIEYGLEKCKQRQKKMMADISFRTKKNLRSRIYVALKRGIKSESTMDLLGCSIEHFKSHFESLFTDGMSWEKYMRGEIHIDHVRPCASYDLTDIEQQRDCFNWKNLQPLWQVDNLKKGKKFELQKVA